MRPYIARRSFTTVSASQLGSIGRAEVVSASDSKWMGSYVQAVVESDDASGADNVDEYFRKNFRKLSSA